MLAKLVGNLILACIRLWVLWFGRDVTDEAWLDGLAGGAGPVGPQILDDVIGREELLAVRAADSGLLPSFGALDGPAFDAASVHPSVRAFYEETARYNLGVEPRWGAPLGWLARLFVNFVGKAADQCNVPRSLGEAQAGMSNEVVELRRRDGSAAATCWMRCNRGHGRVVFAGFYGVERPPLESGPCVRVSFPFPRAYACVILRPTVKRNSDLELVSAGREFGESGFYIVEVARDGRRFAKKVPLVERIHVGLDAEGRLFAAHRFELGLQFLRLDYVLGRKACRAPKPAAIMGRALAA